MFKQKLKRNPTHLSSGTADRVSRERLSKGQVRKWGLGSSRDLKVERERGRERGKERKTEILSLPQGLRLWDLVSKGSSKLLRMWMARKGDWRAHEKELHFVIDQRV